MVPLAKEPYISGVLVTVLVVLKKNVDFSIQSMDGVPFTLWPT